MLTLSNRDTALAEHYNTGLQHMQQGNIHGAITAWSQTLRMRPDHLDALENRSIARRMIGDLRGALEDVNEVIFRDPLRAVPYWVRGEIYGFQGQFQEAIADFEHLIAHHASQIPIERVIASLDHWRKMHELQPTSPMKSEPITTEVAIWQDSQTQIKTVQLVVTKSPTVSTTLAKIHNEDGKPYCGDDNEIIDATYRTLHPIDFINKARVLILEGNYQAALNELYTALEMDPMQAEAYAERGSIYVALGSNLKAQVDLDKALSLNPNDYISLVNRANVELMAGRSQTAIPYIQRAFELAPGYSALHTTYGSFCEAEGNYAVAFAAYDSAIRLDQNSAAAFFNRGRMYMKYQMSRRALSDFLNTLELQPNHARSYFSIGGIYAARGDQEIAEYYYQSAVQFGYEPAQQALKKLQQSTPNGYYPTPVEQWRSDTVDLLAQALIDLATFAYAHCGPFAWQETVQKKSLLGLASRTATETKQRWQVQLQTVNEIDSYGVSRPMQAAVLNFHQSPDAMLRVLPISSNSYSLSAWSHRSVSGKRTPVFTSRIDDSLSLSWSDLPGVLMDMLRIGALEIRGAQLYYTGKAISQLTRGY